MDYVSRLKTARDGTKLSWHRADVDGAPFKGEVPPVSEAELENRIVRKVEAYHRTFDLRIEADAKAYSDVLEEIADGLSQPLARRFLRTRVRTAKDGVVTVEDHVRVYLEWLRAVCVDGKPHLAQRATTEQLLQ